MAKGKPNVCGGGRIPLVLLVGRYKVDFKEMLVNYLLKVQGFLHARSTVQLRDR